MIPVMDHAYTQSMHFRHVKVIVDNEDFTRTIHFVFSIDYQAVQPPPSEFSLSSV